jgi:outer membrane receptor for ferrienterochelin and colicin
MRKRALVFVALGVLITLGSLAPAFGQGATGSVKGQIVDASGEGVAGMTVVLSDARTGLTRVVTSRSDGRFQLQLVPGTYTLKSSGSGYTSVTVEQVMVNVAAVTELTIPIEQSAIEEIVVYATSAPLMATATGETSLHLTRADVSMMPVPRNIESVALLAPGTVPGIKEFGDDKTLVSFGGASVAENIYYIDGLNVSNFRTGLGGSSVPFEFYDQFQIKTGGYSAEFGRSTGGVMNAVTRRGGNEFEFGVVAYFEPELWQGNSPDTTRPDGSYYDLNSYNSESSSTIDLYAGGPIIKDRLFFFALYEPQSSSAEYNWLGSVDRLSKETIENDFWGGNLTWNITDNHSLSYTAFSDERDIVEQVFNYDIDNKTTGELIGDSTGFRGGDNRILSYQGQVSDNFVVSALYGSNEYNLTDLSSNDNDCPVVLDFLDSAASLRPGCEINVLVTTASDKREAYRLDLAYYLGNHKLRAGFDREDNVSFQTRSNSGLALTPDLVGGAGYAQDGGKFRTNSRAWYVEDTWEINNAFTLSVGIRNETFENFNGVDDLYFDIDDQWAPRVALSWSPGGRGDQRVTLNWGRYHLPIMAFPTITLGAAYGEYDRFFVYDGNRDATTAAPVAIGADGIPTTQELGSVIIRGDGSVPEARGSLDTSLKPMYQDEWIIAYERDLGDDWVAGVRYVRRELQSFAVIDRGRLADRRALGHGLHGGRSFEWMPVRNDQSGYGHDDVLRFGWRRCPGGDVLPG